MGGTALLKGTREEGIALWAPLVRCFAWIPRLPWSIPRRAWRLSADGPNPAPGIAPDTAVANAATALSEGTLKRVLS
jgi:hypothetical protein